MKSDAKRQAEYQARQLTKGKARLNCWIDTGTKQAISELSEQHKKSIAEVIELGITAASSLLAGRLVIAKATTKPPVRTIIRPAQREHPLTPDQATCNTSTPPPPQNTLAAPQNEPEQTIVSDADAQIRACTFALET